MQRTIAAAFLALFLPLVALAVEGTFLIPSWQDPTPSRSYLFADHVVINGTWQLPPDWSANIYVYMDNTIDASTGGVTAFGTQMSNTAGNRYYSITNAGGATNKSGTFSFDIGAQPDGLHNVLITFVGGEQCAVNKQINAQTAGGPSPTNYQPECAITSDNFAGNLVWPARNFTVGAPMFPRMVVTPSTNPALNFSNVVFGTTQTMSFTVANTGGQTMTGAISGVSSPFSCVPACGYTINPGTSATMDIKYAPVIPGSSENDTFTFSCNGSSLGCEGQPFSVTTYQPRRVIANNVVNAIAPDITLSQSTIDYGVVNLGVAIPDQTITVSNTGGGILNGVVTFSTTEYTCTGPCSYSLLAGQSTTITIHYVPVAADPNKIDNASFTGGGGQLVTLKSIVNSQPIATTYYGPAGGINFGSNVNVGTCVDHFEYVRNSGAGLLSGSVTNVPVNLSPPANGPAGFSCIANCSYNNLSNASGWYEVTFRFCPVNGNSTSVTAQFTNTSNPSAGASTLLFGQGNVSPLGAFVGSTVFNFGPVLVGSSISRSVTITNSGVGVLNGSVGALPAGYTCTLNCTYSLASGASVAVTITFQPTLVQSYDGSVVISGVGTATLVGSGVEPKFQMSYQYWPAYWGAECPGTTCLPPSPKTYNVGTTSFGGDPSVQNKTFYLYLMNTGSGANVSYSFPNTAHFVCVRGLYGTTACNGSLTPYATGYFYQGLEYEFRPTAATSYNEPLTATYDYGDGVPRSVTLNLQGNSVSAPYLVVTPNGNINLSNIAVGQTATATFSLSNLGVGSLDYTTAIPVSPGVNVSAFRCVRNCTGSGLLTGQTRTVDFTLTPVVSGVHSAYPRFSSNGGIVGYPSSWPYPSISGTGVLQPVIAVTPTSWTFPDTNQGLATQRDITITNTGLGNLSGSVSPVQTPGLNFYCLSGCNYNIAAGNSSIATLEFAPQTIGPLAGVITLNSNAVNGPQTVNVAGRGVLAPIIDIRGGDTNYGPVILGKYKDRTFTIKNTGTVDLGSGYFVVTGPFACVDPVASDGHGHCHYSITAGGETTITIRFAPTVQGPASGAVWLSGVPLARFFVSGTGINPSVKFIEQ